jgi:short-subunit dehydrogenase
MRNIMIIGASRGLGAAFGIALPDAGDAVWLASRTAPFYLDRADGVSRTWIQADLAEADGAKAADTVYAALASQPLDVIVYNAGIWENTAFSTEYNFEKIAVAETLRILTVNLTAAILCIQRLVPNLRRSTNPKVILIGSTSGLDNSSGVEVAYAASKFGLRGVAHALREELRKDAIGVTCINPGAIDTHFTADGEVPPTSADWIPMADIVSLTKCVVSLTRGSCVKEIDLPAMSDTHA